MDKRYQVFISSTYADLKEGYLAAGRSVREAARLAGVSVGIAHRVKQSVAA